MEPLVTFFSQVARKSPVFLHGAVIDFLLYLHLSDFSDPLFMAQPVWSYLVLQHQYDSLLMACANTRTEAKLDSKGDPIHALRSLELPLLPHLELQTRLGERARVWKLMDTELIIFRIQSILKMTRVILQELTDKGESLIHILAVADVMVFLG